MSKAAGEFKPYNYNNQNAKIKIWPPCFLPQSQNPYGQLSGDRFCVPSDMSAMLDKLGWCDQEAFGDHAGFAVRFRDGGPGVRRTRGGD